MPIADRLHNVHQRHLLREFFSNNAHSAEYLSASYIAPAASTGGCTAHTDTCVVVVGSLAGTAYDWFKNALMRCSS